MSDKESQRRKDIRHSVNHQFTSFKEFIREYALNLSENGAFIRTKELLPVGSKVRLKFTVLVDDFESIEGIGEVVRVVETGGAEEPGMGVIFTSLTEPSRETLSRLFTKASHIGDDEEEVLLGD